MSYASEARNSQAQEPSAPPAGGAFRKTLDDAKAGLSRASDHAFGPQGRQVVRAIAELPQHFLGVFAQQR